MAVVYFPLAIPDVLFCLICLLPFLPSVPPSPPQHKHHHIDVLAKLYCCPGKKKKKKSWNVWQLASFFPSWNVALRFVELGPKFLLTSVCKIIDPPHVLREIIRTEPRSYVNLANVTTIMFIKWGTPSFCVHEWITMWLMSCFGKLFFLAQDFL